MSPPHGPRLGSLSPELRGLPAECLADSSTIRCVKRVGMLHAPVGTLGQELVEGQEDVGLIEVARSRRGCGRGPRRTGEGSGSAGWEPALRASIRCRRRARRPAGLPRSGTRGGAGGGRRGGRAAWPAARRGRARRRGVEAGRRSSARATARFADRLPGSRCRLWCRAIEQHLGALPQAPRARVEATIGGEVRWVPSPASAAPAAAPAPRSCRFRRSRARAAAPRRGGPRACASARASIVANFWGHDIGPMDVFSADWTGICRRVVVEQQAIFDRVRGSAERTVYEGVGEGGDRSLMDPPPVARMSSSPSWRSWPGEGASFVAAVSEERGEVAWRRVTWRGW